MNVKDMSIAAGFIAALTLAGSVFAGEVNLRTLAVEDGSGNLVVLWDEHTSGWWAGNQYTPFDGSTSAFIDPRSTPDPTWVGYELTTPQVVARPLLRQAQRRRCAASLCLPRGRGEPGRLL